MLRQEVSIAGDGVQVAGELTLPERAVGVVVFAHGSGSSRFSPRNQYVASVLQRAGLGTLLMDLLTEMEAADRQKVFDIILLGQRLRYAKTWLGEQAETRELPLGYFGASTGAAAALVAAAQDPQGVRAVVSRGGRPDLAEDFLPLVSAPTLLLVGERDEVVLELNQKAAQLLRCPHEIVIIPNATHLFPEPGALEQVAQLARDWFLKYLTSTLEQTR
ncbi:MAG: dienelactone hydrolase family protein [Gemmatales bacterium]|nr:dienelactone hydrolase family protein [Gemmatales bacterium]MDW8175411.1 dienelactone hydrolase family protein [Gemmatales bacterium]